MNYVKMTGAQFRDMMVAGAVLLEKNKQMVNALNVFPVPDGDTGTNMSMTMQSAVREMRACPDNATLTEVADALSIGALKGARGNSGVILSQIFRGFSRALKGAAMLDGKLFSEALTMGAGRPARTSTSKTLSKAAESEPPAWITGLTVASSVPKASAVMRISWLRIQLALPRRVLISPL